MASSGDEEKKEADDEVAGGGGIGRSISEQRAARLRRRRGGSGGDKDSRRGADRDAVIAEESAPAGEVAAAADNCEGAGGDADGYTSAYTAVRRKYSHHVSMMERGDGSGLSKALRASREARGVKVIGQRWKAQLNQGSYVDPQPRNVRQRTDRYDSDSDSDSWDERSNMYNSDADEGGNDTAEDEGSVPLRTMQSSLVFRRTGADHCKAITFLNDQTILSIDNNGELRVVGLPLSVSEEGGGDNPGSVGKLMAQMPVIPKMAVWERSSLAYRLHEPYGYRRGERFVIGMPGGRMQLFSTEKMEGYDWVENCAPDGPGHAWSTLETQRPKRRIERRSNFSLASMLQMDRSALLQEVYITPGELPDVDSNSRFPSGGNIWAFREGGIGGGSGTALLGACVDVESDCFSLRVMDERVGGLSSAAPSHVFVDMSSRAGDEIQSICFSGEHGIVTSHASTETKGHPSRENIIKWWDHRMLRDQPRDTITPVFPRDGVSGVSSESEYLFCGSSNKEEQCDGGRVHIRPLDHGAFSPSEEWETLELIGSRDASDRFAVERSNGELRQLLVIDSAHREVVQRETLPGSSVHGIVSLSCSSNLDFAACHSSRIEPYQLRFQPPGPLPRTGLTIYDISRHKYDNSKDCLGGMKRQSGCLDSGATSDEYIGGLLGRVQPQFQDVYGIASNACCIALNESGSQLACGTKDGDVFVMQPGRHGFEV
ncbi:hypothetical protein ACHAXT_003655 [Thalassiosira profunda]